jgi:transcriptional regulator with PAS, ATPase and Fis domain
VGPQPDTRTHDDRVDQASPAGAITSQFLVVAMECDRPLAGGARILLDGVDRVLIGRGEERGAERREVGGIVTLDVRLPGRSMSAQHARLVRTGASWAIDDLQSTNGTFVNGERVERAVVGTDDLIDVGHTIVLLRTAQRMHGSPADIDSIRDERVGTLITLHEPLARRLRALRRVARSRVPLLVLGETGTGKEVVARALHARSERRGAFVAVNCGAIPETLVESQLFGHVRGAFSGAVSDQLGLVRSADGGTLFLDEIGELPRSSQAALLRVLQEREVLPVGGTRVSKVDLRIASATNQSLASSVERGAFRSDLFARLAGLSLVLPPLRERKEDLGALIADLLARIANGDASEVVFAPEAARLLFEHDWPLNVRELEQCLGVALALAESPRIDESHVRAGLERGFDEPETPDEEAPPLPDDPLRLTLLELLATHKGRVVDVARAMGKARPQIHRWLKRYGIDPNVYRR